MEYSQSSSKKKKKNLFKKRCETECPECLGSGTIFDGKDYNTCSNCKGNGIIKIIKRDEDGEF